MSKPGFQEIYPFATENVKGYFNRLDIYNKNILTVGSSLDQAFNAYLLGAKNVTVFDINPYTKEFFRLKKQAIMYLSREELYQTLTSRRELEYFAKQLKLPLGDIEISSDQLTEDAIFENNIYLLSDNTYERLRKILKKKTPNFITGDIFQIEKSSIDTKFDIMILSNILQYITTFYPKKDPFKVLKETFPKLKELLEDDGTLQLLYLYSYSQEQARKNDHPIPVYRLKQVNDAIDEQLSIEWIKGTLYTYNKHDKDAIVTYQKKGR